MTGIERLSALADEMGRGGWQGLGGELRSIAEQIEREQKTDDAAPNRRAERTCRNELSGYTDYAGRPVPDQFRCSQCGEHSTTMFDIGFGDMASKAPRYCPNCGAKVVEG